MLFSIRACALAVTTERMSRLRLICLPPFQPPSPRNHRGDEARRE